MLNNEELLIRLKAILPELYQADAKVSDIDYYEDYPEDKNRHLKSMVIGYLTRIVLIDDYIAALRRVIDFTDTHYDEVFEEVETAELAKRKQEEV